MVSYSTYDSDNRVRRYAESLVKQGHRVDAISLRQDGQPRKGVLNGVRVFRIQRRVRNEKSNVTYLSKLLLFFFRSMFLLTSEQCRERYDLIHVHSVPDFEVFAAFFPKLTGSRVILDIHDIVPEFYASKFNVSSKSLIFKLLVLVERMSAAFSDHVITANHIWQERLSERSVKKSKCTAILNFPDTNIFFKRGRSRNDAKFIILYPGTLNYHQGVDIAIRAFTLIKEEVPEAEFHIYGSGDQVHALGSLIAELGLGDKVFLKGSVSIDEISSIMENADLGVVPKRKNFFGNEAFSTKILEFMCLGVPIVVPNTAIDQYYFNDSVAQFFSADNTKSLAEAMLRVIQNPELRNTLVKNASTFVEKYIWAENQANYLNLVNSLVNPQERCFVPNIDKWRRGITNRLPCATGRSRGSVSGGLSGQTWQNEKNTSFNQTILQTLLGYYRLSVDSLGLISPANLSGDAGFFRFGSETICYGQCGSGVADKADRSWLYGASQSMHLTGSQVHVQCDPVQMIETLRRERYMTSIGGRKRIVTHELIRNAYYLIREYMPVWARSPLQDIYFNDWQKLQFPKWPVDLTVDTLHRELLRLSMETQGVSRVPFIWFWPEGAPSCMILTHDVETANGRNFTSSLMDLDESYGFKGSIQVVPENRYAVPDDYVREIRAREFELNIHDLNHDGHLYQEREEFLRRARKINDYARKYNSRGFRSGSMYRNLDWYDAYEFSYDMSVPNVAHLEPQRGGCCTVMPYFIGKILEIPLTTSQDYSLFHILRDYSIDLWKKQINLILNRNGLISFISHPDYLVERRARKVYESLLDHLRQVTDRENLWAALPGDVDRWWRARNQMKLVSRGSDWEIEGPQKERARLAYAIINEGRLKFEIAGAANRENMAESRSPNG
jgi:glycosyltransferase involved in cell wall biosynthesis